MAQYKLSPDGALWYVEAFDGASWKPASKSYANKATAAMEMIRLQGRDPVEQEHVVIGVEQIAQVSTLPTEIPDTERCALTLLARADITHPAVKLWVACLVEDGDYQGSLQEYVPAEGFDAAKPMAYGGFYSTAYDWAYQLMNTPDMEYTIESGEAYPPIIRDRRRHWIELDQAVLSLAHQVVYYRLHNRPAGDITLPVHGGGDPLVLMHTSLAANIANYHANVCHVYDARIERLMIEHDIQEERI